jgi:FkbM family methyltransferase
MHNPNILVSSDYGPMIVNRYDQFIGASISQFGYWSNDDIGLIKSLIEFRLKNTEKVLFYDVGANIGTHSLAFAKIFQDKITIRSFEAQRLIFYMLCGTIALNGLNNIKLENIAVSDIDRSFVDIHLPDYTKNNNFGGFELVPAERSDNHSMVKSTHESIETRTLDSYGEFVDFIKMDIEGMEDKALRGAVNLIDASRPICFIEILKTDKEFVSNFFRGRNYAGFKKQHDLILIPLECKISLQNLSQVF